MKITLLASQGGVIVGRNYAHELITENIKTLDAYSGFFRKLSNGAKSWYYLCSFHQNYVQPSCSHATEFQFCSLNICLLSFPALDEHCILENSSRALSLTWKSLFWMASWPNVKDPEFNKRPHLLLFFPLISKHFPQSPLFSIYGMAKLIARFDIC